MTLKRSLVLCSLASLLLLAFQPFCFAKTNSAETTASSWQYTFEQPGEGWQTPDFDDSGWKTGKSGFGSGDAPGAIMTTQWNTSDIWLRQTINVADVPEQPVLLMHHDDEVQVYINGTKVVELGGWTTKYELVTLDSKFRSVIKKGENVIAVHCHQDAGGQYIDVRFGDASNPPALPKGHPFESDLITKWGEQVTAENAWTEYPRPQMERTEWTNLNGHWDYAITKIGVTKTPSQWDGEILVPFCLESKLGGVQEYLAPEEALWYHRSFDVAKKDGMRTLLNFEAVDYACEAFVNGKSVGKHQGGNTPFSFDITDAAKNGENELVLRVEDATGGSQLRGKQVQSAGGIWYTRVSGIWQTVWTEQVANSYLSDLTIHTDAKAGTIKVASKIEGKQNASSVRLLVKDGDKTVATAKGKCGDELAVTIDGAKLWSPSSPFLYDLEVSLLDASGKVLDQVDSYAGIRTVGKTRDENGHWRMTLNGEVLFHWGPLDQGWWPDGLLTPPSDEAMAFDIEWLRDAGFNMIRKHIKVEPRRYYYHCDRMGMMVWQDQVSGGKSPRWTFLEPNPNDAEWSDEDAKQFIIEFERMVDALENHPSIVVWVPFNEAWGQHRTVEVGNWIIKRDPSRLVNIASGGNFWPVGDIADRHNYPAPAFPLDNPRFNDYVKVVGEFGGHGYPIEGHLWDPSKGNWGYGGLPKTMEEYRDRYAKTLQKLNELRKQGIAGGVYTQTTDVEVEINGLMTYDRKSIKIPAEQLKEMHQKLYSN